MFCGIGATSSVTQAAGAPAGGVWALPNTLVVEVKTKAPTPASTASSSRFSVPVIRSEEHTSELQSLMRISYAVFCLKKTKKQRIKNIENINASHSIDQHKIYI